MLDPFFSGEEGIAETIDDIFCVLGDGNDLILVLGPLVVQDDIGVGGHHPGRKVVDSVDKEEAKIHVGFYLCCVV